MCLFYYKWYNKTYGPIAHFINECVALCSDGDNNKVLVDESEIKLFITEKEPSKTVGNILVIFFESLESSVIDKVIDGEEICPALNKLKNNPKSKYFTLKSQVRQGKSSDSELIYFTGLLPIYNGSTAMRYATNIYPSWVADYPAKTKLAAVPTSPNAWNQAAFLPSLGFDSVFGNEMSDKAMVNIIRNKIVSVDQPFVIFHTTMASHAPFIAYKDWSYIQLSSVFDSTLRNYLRSINYSDACLSSEISTILNDSILSKNTRILILGDHPILDLEASVPMIYYDPMNSKYLSDNQLHYQAELYSFIREQLQLGSSWKGFGNTQTVQDDAYWTKVNNLSDYIIRNNYFLSIGIH